MLARRDRQIREEFAVDTLSRKIRLLSVVGALSLAAISQTFAADVDPAILATIDAAIGAINAGSASDLQANFTEAPAAITDDFAPFAWSGKTAVADYMRDFQGILTQYKITDGRFQRHAPRYIFASDTRAEAVIPASFPFILGGKPQDVSADWLFVLDKVDGKWKIDVMAYVDSHHTLIP
jgi:hypothetical protein